LNISKGIVAAFSLPWREGVRGRGINNNDRTANKGRVKKTIVRKLRRDQTDAERTLWARLRSKQLRGAKFRRQQLIGPYIVDFINFDSRLVLEIDGSQHNEEEMRQKDEDRTMWLRERGYQVLRFWDNEVLQNVDSVLERILAALK
jgi:very-short-patch-repair endonuclease